MFHRLEKGIITGCTISVTLFALAMNMLVKSAEPECRGPLTKLSMDLEGLEHMITWARMEFKPAKSRSLVVRKGKVTDEFRFTLRDIQIPSVREKPIKSLGKTFDATLKDAAALQETTEQLAMWLKEVDKSGLPGKFKAWIYQHGILPRLLWPLMVYDVPVTTVESYESKVSSYLRRWLGLPRSLSSTALYGRKNKLQLPFNSLAEEFKVTRARQVLLYRDSSDSKVARAGIEVRTGRKWKAHDAVAQAEARLKHSELTGTLAHGRAGFGSNTKPIYSKTRGKERRKLIQDEVRAEVEEARGSKIVAMGQQGAWSRWEHASNRRISWADLWKFEPHRIKFLIQSVYDVLPTPSNLFRWGLVDTPSVHFVRKQAH
ncbi:hypothetical protein WMY93_025096 [Mugilogobius chulae]|uniref:Reverse transcriptase n=1 Tax=Mugilogobius chulae TaxID=88201 RepID=A0AAW0NDZ9_9GOBI